jgi:hypothetical protein
VEEKANPVSAAHNRSLLDDEANGFVTGASGLLAIQLRACHLTGRWASHHSELAAFKPGEVFIADRTGQPEITADESGQSCKPTGIDHLALHYFEVI